MAAITRPKRGGTWKNNRGYIEGVYLIGGRRAFKGLGRADAFTHTAGGRLRTPDQLHRVIEHAWDAKREELEAEMGAEAAGDARGIIDAMDEWIQRAPDNGIKKVTIDVHYRLMQRQYKAGVGNHPLRDMSILKLDDFKAHLKKEGLGPVTVNIRLSKLRVFLNWAARRKYLKALPVIEMLKEPKKRPRTPQPQQAGAFIREMLMLATLAPDKRHRYFYELHFMELLFVLGTGVRRSGPLFTTWADTYLDQGACLMREYKGGETLVFLPAMLTAYLANRRQRYPQHKWLFDSGRGVPAYKDAHAMTTSFRRHKKRLGYGGVEFKPLHGFRANFATVNLNELGVDSSTVSKLLDHSSYKTTENSYIADMAMAKRKAMDAFEAQYLEKIIDGNLMENGFEQIFRADPIGQKSGTP